MMHQPVSVRHALQVFILISCGMYCATRCTATEPESASILSPRNPEVPFSFIAGGAREWPILAKPLPEGASVRFSAFRNNILLAEGTTLEIEDLRISMTQSGRLRIEAPSAADSVSLRLQMTLTQADTISETQQIEIRPAPPDRPISYYSDFGDDLILIFMNQTSGQFQPVTRDAFDQYFRRLQAHGVKRLVVWLSPFPFT